MQEIIDALNKCQSNKCKIRYGEEVLLFTRNAKDGYWINRKECLLYGLAITDNGTIIYGYPHLLNIKDDTEIHLENCILEQKENGTCIIVSVYNGVVNIRTRMSAFPIEFPVPPFFNETINQIEDKNLKERILTLRTVMLSKYPEWYLNESDGTYIGLKIQKVVRDLLDVDTLTSTYPQYVFYLELIGRINPIIIDSEMKYGLYPFDYDLVLFDIYDKQYMKFLSRESKEIVVSELLDKDIYLEIVPIRYNFSKIEDLRKAIPEIKRAADDKLSEGFVLKNGVDIIKVKSDIVLDGARRLEAIMKGFIGLNDMYGYIAKVVTAEYLKSPEKFDELVELVGEEARADYPDEIVVKNKKDIQKRIAYSMSLLVVDKILSEKKFDTSDELFRFLNIELPKHFSPLKSYIDYESEKLISDKKEREKAKRIRVALFSHVAKYVCRKLGIDRGGYNNEK